MCGKQAAEIRCVPCQIAAGHVGREFLLLCLKYISEGSNKKSKQKTENEKDYFS
jgi:hypothetical protein